MNRTARGFTIVEIMVIVAIIGILTAIGFVSFGSIQSSTRDYQRSSRVKLISEALEKYYDNNGEYPGCTAMSQTPATVVNDTLQGLDPNVLTAPSAESGTNSISALCADLTAGVDGFSYIGDTNSACLTGNSCLRYTLKYKEEGSGTVKLINSRRLSGSH